MTDKATHSATKPLAFIGSGSMNTAIVAGILAGGWPAELLRATVASEAGLARLRQNLGQAADRMFLASLESSAGANREAAAGAAALLIGVKPYRILELAAELRQDLAEDTLIISLAAGVSLASLQEAFGPQQAVIRCMPNTPAKVGKGVLAYACGSRVSPDQAQLAAHILGSVGQAIPLAEQQFDAVTALSGSGPAYVFLLAETMAQAAIKLGLEPETAYRVAGATVAGAGYLLEENPDPASLRRAVTSPGGTTEQAILSFERDDLAGVTLRAMQACAQKSAEMSKLYRR